MKKTGIYFLILLITGAMIACNANYHKKSNGLVYKIFKSGGAPIKNGQFLKVNFLVKVGDSVLVNSYQTLPAYGTYDSTVSDTHDFLDFLGEMAVGDSAVFIRNIDTLERRGQVKYNEIFKPKGVINCTVKLEKAFDSKELMMADQEKGFMAVKDKEVLQVEQYLQNIKATGFKKLPEGVFVKIEREGTGNLIDSAGQVSILYTGKLLNGQVFDSNVDSAFGHLGAYKLKVGVGQVIRGWDIGLKAFKKGSKGVIVVPSMLGYGSTPQGDLIPPFSNLYFDIEVVDYEN